jgi:SAM-dependent methyltransferase
MNIFQKYSAYYDLFYADKDYKNESAYVHRIVSDYGKTPKRVLNLGCGTGNHDFYFHDFGWQLTSIDSSIQAIEMAESKKKKKGIPDESLRFVHSDIRKLKLNEKFDCALALFHVINYLTTNEDLLSCFRSVSEHLSSGGLFVFDSWYGPAVLHDLPSARTKKMRIENSEMTRKSIPSLLPNENVVNVQFNFEIEDPKNKHIESFTEVHSMRYLFMPEIKLLLSETGFELVHGEEWMTGKQLGSTTWYGLFVCKKI